MKVFVTVQDINLVAHRAGERFGKKVTESQEEDPAKYYLLKNNDWEEKRSRNKLRSPDYANEEAPNPREKAPNPGEEDSVFFDDDLACLELKQIPFERGFVELEVSEESDVHLFAGDDGKNVKEGQLLDKTRVNLSNPKGGYLTNVNKRDVTVWLEGKEVNRDLTIKFKYTGPAGGGGTPPVTLAQSGEGKTGDALAANLSVQSPSPQDPSGGDGKTNLTDEVHVRILNWEFGGTGATRKPKVSTQDKDTLIEAAKAKGANNITKLIEKGKFIEGEHTAFFRNILT